MTTQDDFIEGYKWALFVGECGGEAHSNPERYIDFLKSGLAFLLQNFEKVPNGCELGRIWFNYNGLFPAIGLASDLEPENEPQSLREQVKSMEEAIQIFDRAVDWQSLSACIDVFGEKYSKSG